MIRAAHRRRRPRRPLPRRLAGGLVRRRARAQGRLPGTRRRRVRAPARGDRGRRPGALLRAQGALPPLRGAQPPGRAHRTPLGRARVVARGRDATVVTYGSGVDTALPRSAARRSTSRSLDLRTVWPLDEARCSTSLEQDVARARAAGGRTLDRRRRARPLPRRAEGFELLDAPPALARAARHARSVRARARGRVPPVRRVARPPSSRSCLPTDRAPTAPASTALTRLALFRLDAAPAARSRSATLTLYRQGRIAGSRLRRARSGGRRGRRPGSRSGRTTSSRRSTASKRATSRAGSRRADVFRNFLGRADRPDPRPRREHALRRARRSASSRSSRCSATSPGHGRRRARLQAPRRAARGADLPRRGRVLRRRRARRPQPRGRAGRCPPSSCSRTTSTRTRRRPRARW